MHRYSSDENTWEPHESVKDCDAFHEYMRTRHQPAAASAAGSSSQQHDDDEASHEAFRERIHSALRAVVRQHDGPPRPLLEPLREATATATAKKRPIMYRNIAKKLIERRLL